MKAHEPVLFSEFKLRNYTFKNRIGLPPMDLFCCKEDGIPTNFSFCHYGSMAIGGVGSIICEVCAISPEGRISPKDAGIWNDTQKDAWKPITEMIKSQNCIPLMQIGHAGRKASTYPPYENRGVYCDAEHGGWKCVCPHNLPFDEEKSASGNNLIALDENGIKKVIDDFVAASKRAIDAGFEGVEIHAAHGYLLNQFLSPICNKRNDNYGGSFENRIKILIEIVQKVRKAIGEKLMLVRLSCTDWREDGWSLDDSIKLCKILKPYVDMINCSSAGIAPNLPIPLSPSYMVFLSEKIRKEVEIPTAAVGLIYDGFQANEIIENGKADMVLVGRELLRNPHWVFHVARNLGASEKWPNSYAWAVGKASSLPSPPFAYFR